MINFNGDIIDSQDITLNLENRGFRYGDAIFDTLKFNNEIQFLEDHYFRLMSSMRMLRMKIPMHFTLQFYENEIRKTIISNKINGIIRIRVTFFRNNGGLYLPKTNEVSYIIEVNPIKISKNSNYKIDLYKDFTILSGLLSTIKTNNRIINVLANIYADENGLQNCVLMNEKKNIVEVSNANIFLIKENQVFTPPLTDGCINGIIRKHILEILNQHTEFKIVEKSLIPFDLLNADEIFITNSIIDIQSITNYRKKIYEIKKTYKIKKLFKDLLA